MERLTHQRVSGIKAGYWTQSRKDELVERLALYEDTGLEPQEIMELKDLYRERCAELRIMQEAKEQQEHETAEKASRKQDMPPKMQQKAKVVQLDASGGEKKTEGEQPKKKKKDGPSGVPGPYKGFMHIQCPRCGAVKNFCSRKETEIFYCDSCKSTTHLENMAKVLLKCECGKTAVYYTNRYDAAFDIDCVQCEAPVCVEWNKRAKRYTTVRNGGY